MSAVAWCPAPWSLNRTPLSSGNSWNNAELQAEVIRARVQMQASELRQLRQEVQQAAWSPEKEELELSGPQSQNQMQTLDKRLVEVREALTHIRRKQALQDSERKHSEQEINLRLLTNLTAMLSQEEQGREAACSSLQKNQEDTSQKVDLGLAKMQAQMTKLNEEMSLRFLKREAKLCSFLQKSFLALEQRMKSSESTRLMVESSLREDLESRWQKLHELTEERLRVLRAQREQEEEGHLLEQCRGLDKAVVYLTKFVRQNQVSLNRVLMAEQKAREAKVSYEETQAGELASYVRENLEAMQMAGRLAQQGTQEALELLQEKSQVLEGSVAGLDQQLKDLSDHCLALSWRLDLQEQTLSLKLSQSVADLFSIPVTKQLHCQLLKGMFLLSWMALPGKIIPAVISPGYLSSAAQAACREGVERESLQDLVRWLKEVSGHLQEVQDKVNSLPQQIESVSNKCVLHKSDVDVKISAEGKARAFEVETVRQELATLLMSVQLLKEENPGRKIAEIQGQLATFQKQMMKLENSLQANKTIQNLKFNNETKLEYISWVVLNSVSLERTEEIAALRESMLHLWSEEGPWPLTLGSKRAFMSLVRQRFFVKDIALGEMVSVNSWGVYQAVRWVASLEDSPLELGGPETAQSDLSDDPVEACI
ncbi:Coiled-coil domain-containing protein 154 [Apodemus speciosus]|uniref:Coiled-coil domain-containing protein 154 n=1 Tax=Apodemus speciosus TaxID=105296 RepID=A0ABQ0FN81_APOSI